MASLDMMKKVADLKPKKNLAVYNTVAEIVVKQTADI